LRCQGARDKTKYFGHIEPRVDSQLAVSPPVQKILEAKKLEGPCNSASSRELEANLRNTFVIKRYVKTSIVKVTKMYITIT
jgi:hypothetical protein